MGGIAGLKDEAWSSPMASFAAQAKMSFHLLGKLSKRDPPHIDQQFLLRSCWNSSFAEAASSTTRQSLHSLPSCFPRIFLGAASNPSVQIALHPTRICNLRGIVLTLQNQNTSISKVGLGIVLQGRWAGIRYVDGNRGGKPFYPRRRKIQEIPRQSRFHPATHIEASS
jgi:hypothetical protein